MDEEFRNKVLEPVRYVLTALDSIESDPESVEPDALKARLRALLGKFELQGPLAAHYELARHALVAWADEVMINAHWAPARQWRHEPLELEFFGTRNRAWRFFHQAEEARGLPGTDSLEVFALCVANGFRGVYRNPEMRLPDRPPEFVEAAPEKDEDGRQVSFGGFEWPADEDVESRRVIESLPETLGEWADSVFMEVLGDPLRDFQCAVPYDSARVAHPLTGRLTLVRWSGAAAVLLLLTVIIVSTVR